MLKKEIICEINYSCQTWFNWY